LQNELNRGASKANSYQSIDVAVPFSKIDVAKLAAFLGVSEAAGGTIKTVKGSVVSE
jgi:hypothetical protein